jgi:hypothetical protein
MRHEVDAADAEVKVVGPAAVLGDRAATVRRATIRIGPNVPTDRRRNKC